MFEMLKQTLYCGVGLAGLAQDKVAELAKEISIRAGLAKEEAQEFKETLLKRSEEARRDLGEEIDRRVDSAFIQAGIVKGAVNEKAREGRDALQALVDERIDAALDRMDVARGRDLKSISARLAMLESKLPDAGA